MKWIALCVIVLAVLAGCAGTEPTATSPLPTGTWAPPPTIAATQPASPTAQIVPSATASPVPTEASPTITVPPATVTTTPVDAEPAIVIIRDGDLWLKQLANGGQVQLTNLGDVVDLAEFSPDGQLVLFRREGPPATVSSSMPEPVPTTTWWAVPVSGDEPWMILDPLASLPATHGSGALAEDVYPSEAGPFDWLPDGRQILFTSRYLTINALPGNYDLWRLDIENGQLENLLPAGQGGRPVVSPDGAWVLLNTPAEIAVARTEGSERRTLLSFERVPTYSEWEWVPEPVWNEDGSVHVATARPWNVGEPVTYELWRLEPASGDTQWLGLVDTWWLNTPLWSPDRSRLAYATEEGLMLAGGGGENPRLVAAGENVVPVAWSLAGTWLAFVQGDQHCVVEDREGAKPVCPARVFYGDADWLDDSRLVVVANAGEDQPQFVAVELPAGTVTDLWSVAPPLFYDLYLGR